MKTNFRSIFTTVLAVSVLVFGVLSSASAQRRGFGGRSGGFGGGGFGGGGMSRGFGGGTGSFGGGQSRSSGGFGTRSSAPSGSFNRTGSSSFNRSGSFGSSGRVNSTSISTPRGSFISRSPVYYGGGRYYGYYGGGYGDYWYHPMWYYWTPFHPAFYFDQPYYSDGAYYPGGFSFTKFLIGIAIIIFIFWVIGRIFRGGGGGGGIRYTMYR